MVDAAVTQEPADLQELLYAKSKPVLANMLAPELAESKANNYRVTKVERAGVVSIVTLEITKDPEVDISNATADQIREVSVNYEHHSLQSILNHYLGSSPIAVKALPASLDDINEMLLEATDKVLLDEADISILFNGLETSLYVKNPNDLRWYGAAHLQFTVVEGDGSDVPGKSVISNVQYNVENRTVTADVTNATSVKITTSTGLTFTAQTNMETVSYQFAEALPAGTVITVSAGTAKDTVEVPKPEIDTLVYDDSLNRVWGIILNAVSATISMADGFNATAPIEGNELNYYFSNPLPGGSVITVDFGGGIYRNLVAPTNLVNVKYVRETSLFTADVDGELAEVNITAPNGFNAMVPVVNGSITQVIDNVPDGEFYISVTFDGRERMYPVAAKPLPTITNVVYDYKTNTITADVTNATTVKVSSVENAVADVPVTAGKLNYTLPKLVNPRVAIIVKAGTVTAQAVCPLVQTLIEGVHYPDYTAAITLPIGIDNVSTSLQLNGVNYVPANQPEYTLTGSEKITIDAAGVIIVTDLAPGETATAELTLKVDGREANGANLIITREAE